MISLAALFYGDYPELAQRLLRSLADCPPPADVVVDFRIGLNAAGAATRQIVEEFLQGPWRSQRAYVFEPPRNVGKYPLMRRMYYGKPLADRVMWFDDDSHLTTQDPTWWSRAYEQAQACTVLGSLWRIDLRGRQAQGIAAQLWYAGQPVVPPHRFHFATGGWTVAESAFLQRWNYPFPELFHNGGDSILGELVRQQGGKLLSWHEGVEINVGGRRARRGLGVAQEVYVWQNYLPGQSADLSHHDFPCRVYTYL